MNKPYTIEVRNLDGWWSAICRELCVSGFGPSEKEAISSLIRSMRSTLMAQASSLKKVDDLKKMAQLERV